MYKIIGADQKEYGPVTADQIRQWLVDGRVSGQTRVRVEGTEEWKLLADFPEFGLPAAAPILSSGVDAKEGARSSVKGPAIALIVTAILNFLLGLVQLVRMRASIEGYREMPQFQDPDMAKMLDTIGGPIGYISTALALVVSVLIILGAVRMLSLKGYGLAFTASILAMIPCLTPCCLLGLPFGIWAVVVLSKADVKSQFE